VLSISKQRISNAFFENAYRYVNTPSNIVRSLFWNRFKALRWDEPVGFAQWKAQVRQTRMQGIALDEGNYAAVHGQKADGSITLLKLEARRLEAAPPCGG
jgi:hypothetical protein